MNCSSTSRIVYLLIFTIEFFRYLKLGLSKIWIADYFQGHHSFQEVLIIVGDFQSFGSNILDEVCFLVRIFGTISSDMFSIPTVSKILQIVNPRWGWIIFLFVFTHGTATRVCIIFSVFSTILLFAHKTKQHF